MACEPSLLSLQVINLHDNFLLVRIFEWLASLDRILRLGRNRRTSRQTGNIASHDCAKISVEDRFALCCVLLTVHQDSFSNVIRIMPGYDMVHS